MCRNYLVFSPLEIYDIRNDGKENIVKYMLFLEPKHGMSGSRSIHCGLTITGRLICFTLSAMNNGKRTLISLHRVLVTHVNRPLELF